MILEVIVVPRPTVDVRAVTSRRAEPAQVESMCLDPGGRKTPSDVRMAPGVLRDPVNEKQVGACFDGRGPAQCAQLEAVARSSGAEDASRECRHGATISAGTAARAKRNSPVASTINAASLTGRRSARERAKDVRSCALLCVETLYALRRVDVSGWHDFYIMAGGAAAALTGLVVVALSLHAKVIMAHPLFRDRAFAAIVALMTQVFLAAAVLVPDQSSLALGLEVGLVAAFWLARSVWAIPYIRGNAARLRGRAHEYRRPASHWAAEWTVWIVWVIALIASAMELAMGAANGLYLLAVAMVLMFGSQVWSAWVLIAEVTE